MSAEKEPCLEVELLKREVEELRKEKEGMAEVYARLNTVERKMDKWTGIFIGVWLLASLFWGAFGGMMLSSLRDGMQDIRKTHDDVLIAVQRIGAMERTIDSRKYPAN